MEDQKEVYCGVSKLKPNQRHGTLNECVEANQVRLYGINQVPADIIAMIKAGMKSLKQVNNRYNKLRLELAKLVGRINRIPKIDPKRLKGDIAPEYKEMLKNAEEAEKRLPILKKEIEELRKLKEAYAKPVAKAKKIMEAIPEELILPSPKVNIDNTKVMEDIIKMGLDFEKKSDKKPVDRKVMRPIKIILERHTVSELHKYMNENNIRYVKTDNKDDLIKRILKRESKPNFLFLKKLYEPFFNKYSFEELQKILDKKKIAYDKNDTWDDLIEKYIYEN